MITVQSWILHSEINIEEKIDQIENLDGSKYLMIKTENNNIPNVYIIEPK